MRIHVTAAAVALTTALSLSGAPIQRKPVSNVMFADQVWSSFLIPVAGNVTGQYGTHFRSQVVISNFLDVEQRIGITVIPQGTTGTGQRRIFTLPRVTNGGDLGLVSDDFFGSELGMQGLGAIVVEALTAGDQPDADARIDGFTRIYTTVPNNSGCTDATGTFSQALLTVPVDNLEGKQYPAVTVGMRQDANFRTNVGIVNLSNETLTWTVGAFGRENEGEKTITVGPRSMIQTPAPAGNFGTMTVIFTLTNGSANARWAAYSSSVDNRTGDGFARNAVY